MNTDLVSMRVGFGMRFGFTGDGLEKACIARPGQLLHFFANSKIPPQRIWKKYDKISDESPMTSAMMRCSDWLNSTLD